MVESEYNSIVRQFRVKNYLSTLRIHSFSTDGFDDSAALEKVYKMITKLAPQVPKSYRGDTHKVEFLRSAVVGSAWTTEPLSNIATHSLTFQQLYGELKSALHLEKEAKAAVLRKGVLRRLSPSNRDDEVAVIIYEGQGRYVRQHTGLGNRQSKAGSSNFNVL